MCVWWEGMSGDVCLVGGVSGDVCLVGGVSGEVCRIHCTCGIAYQISM